MNNSIALNVVRRRRGVVEVAQVLARYRASGLTQERFCRWEGIGVSTLSGYLRRERRKGAPSPGVLSAPPLARFLEVEVEQEVESGQRLGEPVGGRGGGTSSESESAAGAKGGADRAYRVEFGGGLSVEVPGGFVAAELERLIAIVLEAAATR